MTTIVSGSSITFNDNTTQNTSAYGGGFAFRNRIINGGMVIDQRNAGAATANTINDYTVDRWIVAQSVTGKLIAQQNAAAVTPPTGFTNYLGVTSQSSYSVLAGDYYIIIQRIEGYNIADLGWGTASAQTITLSFWVRSSLTGTFGGALKNNAANRSYPFTYSIPTANTWTAISVTIAGDTSGTWEKTTSAGIQVQFGLGAGSTFSGTAGAWAGANLVSATGATSVVGTNGATFYITGVQLEKGSTATSFDYRPYSAELAMCQRYYEKSYPYATVAGSSGAGSTIVFVYQNGNGRTGCSVYFKVSKRASPTVTSYDESGNSGKLTYMDNGHNFTATQNAVSTESWSVQGPNATNNSGLAFHYVAVAEL